MGITPMLMHCAERISVSIFVCEHDRKRAFGFSGIARVLRAEIWIIGRVVIDFPEQLFAVEYERSEVVLAVRIVVVGEDIECDHCGDRTCRELGSGATGGGRWGSRGTRRRSIARQVGEGH